MFIKFKSDVYTIMVNSSKLISIFSISSLFISTGFSTTITVTQNYGLENSLLATFIGCSFLFWLFIYFNTPDFKWQKKDIIKSIAITVNRFFNWMWFIVLFYLFQAILFISKDENFLDGKLYIINTFMWITVIGYLFVGFLFLIKIYNQMAGVGEFFKELKWQLSGGDDDE